MTASDRQESLDLLYPRFRACLEAGLARAASQGVIAYPFETWRAPSRQNDLYNQGREGPGPVITNARAWASWHQYGLATDLAFGGPGRWTWDGDWPRLGAAMQAEGLEWYGAPGSPYKETPHVQMTFGLSLGEAQYLAKTFGIPAVWAAAATAAAASK